MPWKGKKKTPSHQNSYKFCTTPWTYCSEYEPKASIVWWVAQVHCLYIEDEDWLVCFDCDALEMKKKTPSHKNFYKFCTTPGTYCSEYEPKSLYCLMGWTGSLFIHRGWRLAGLFRLWCPGNEKKTPSHQNSYKFCTTPGTYCSEYDPKSLYWSMGCTGSLFIHRGWRLAGLFRLWRPGNEKRLLRTRIFTSSAPRPGRIVPSTNQKASIDRWVAQVHCLYIEDEDWLVCFDCDAMEMKKRLLRTRIFTSSAPRPGRIVPSTTQKASIDRWVAQVHCWYIEDEDWQVCFDCDALEMKKKRLLRTRILTCSAPRPGRIVPSTNQKASIVWWVAQVHCLYIEDEDWLVCYDCDALEMKKKTPSHQNFYKFCTTPWTYCSEYEPKSLYWSMGCTGSLFIHRGWRLAGLFRLWRPGNGKKRLLRTRIFTSSAPRPGRIVPSTTQKASIDRWVAQVHCWYIEDEDWKVCFDCDALEMKKKDSFAPEFLQVLHHALDVLFRVRTKKPLLFDGLHRFIVYT